VWTDCLQSHKATEFLPRSKKNPKVCDFTLGKACIPDIEITTAHEQDMNAYAGGAASEQKWNEVVVQVHRSRNEKEREIAKTPTDDKLKRRQSLM
jgi:hypothetical protein